MFVGAPTISASEFFATLDLAALEDGGLNDTVSVDKEATMLQLAAVSSVLRSEIASESASLTWDVDSGDNQTGSGNHNVSANVAAASALVDSSVALASSIFLIISSTSESTSDEDAEADADASALRVTQYVDILSTLSTSLETVTDTSEQLEASGNSVNTWDIADCGVQFVESVSTVTAFASAEAGSVDVSSATSLVQMLDTAVGMVAFEGGDALAQRSAGSNASSTNTSSSSQGVSDIVQASLTSLCGLALSSQATDADEDLTFSVEADSFDLGCRRSNLDSSDRRRRRLVDEDSASSTVYAPTDDSDASGSFVLPVADGATQTEVTVTSWDVDPYVNGLPHVLTLSPLAYLRVLALPLPGTPHPNLVFCLPPNHWKCRSGAMALPWTATTTR